MGHRRGAGIITAALLMSALFVGCGGDTDGSTTTEPTNPGASAAVLVDGRPGWVAAVDEAPEGVGAAATWTGSALATAGYGPGQASGVLRVVRYDPERGDWLDAGEPFGDLTTTDAVLGHDADGRVSVVAACEPNETDPHCPPAGIVIAVLVLDRWKQVPAPSPRQQAPSEVTAAGSRDGATPDRDRRVTFVGPAPRGAAFTIDHRLVTVTPEMAEVTDESGIDPVLQCRAASGTFAIGDPNDADPQIRWRLDGGNWEPVQVEATLRDALGTAADGAVALSCHNRGLTVAVALSGESVVHSLSGAPAGPAWRTCRVPVADPTTITEVGFLDGRSFVISHPEPQASTGDVTTTLIECRNGLGTVLTTSKGPAPTVVAAAEPVLLLAATGTDLHLRVLAP